MLRKVLSIIGCIITILVAVIFAFIELRAVVAGDFSLMNNPTNSILRYLFRGLFYLFMFALATSILISKIKNNKIEFTAFGAAVGVFIGALISLAFYHLIVGVIVIVIALIPLLITILDLFVFVRKVK